MTKISNQYSLTNVLTADPVNGRVGIGNTTSPSRLLEVASGGDLGYIRVSGNRGNADGVHVGSIEFYNSFSSILVGEVKGITGTGGTQSASGQLAFYTNNAGTYAERMRITSAGNVGIGTSSPANTLDVQTSSGVGSSTSTGLARFITAGTTTAISVGQSNSARRLDIRTEQIKVTGDQFALQTADAQPILFETSATERMRITSGGNVGIGTSTPLSGLGNGLTIDGSTYATLYLSNSGTQRGYFTAYSGGLIVNANTGGILALNNGGTNVLIGSTTDTGQGHILQVTGAGRFTSSITASLANFNNLGTGTVYSSGGILTSTNPSDKRLKKDIQDISYGLSDILKLKPVSYVWIDDQVNQGVQFGFIAQDVQSVMPDAVKEFGEEKHLGLEKDAIYATLVKAIQEQQTQINELKALLNA